VIGRELVAAGQIDDEGDVFYLTYDEALGRRVPEDLRAVIGQRRALREDYLTTALPEKWTGPPVRVPLDDADAERGDRTTVDGVAVGGGLVTARVRVIIDPDEDDLEEGEILVCRNTDPSWTALFHLAGGIAVDMGGHMSHGAIVARELGLPCVTSTVDGTRALRTGDLVRLDGDNGTIEILEGANDK
jgi:pyruvate,water dikinase